MLEPGPGLGPGAGGMFRVVAQGLGAGARSWAAVQGLVSGTGPRGCGPDARAGARSTEVGQGLGVGPGPEPKGLL